MMRTRVCIISLVRLKALLTNFSETDGTYRNSLPTTLTLVESALGVTSACLIVMRPIFGRFFPDRLKFTRKGGGLSAPSTPNVKQLKSHRQKKKSPMDTKGISEGKFVRLNEDPYARPSLSGKEGIAERVVALEPLLIASHSHYKDCDVEAQ